MKTKLFNRDGEVIGQVEYESELTQAKEVREPLIDPSSWGKSRASGDVEFDMNIFVQTFKLRKNDGTNIFDINTYQQGYIIRQEIT